MLSYFPPLANRYLRGAFSSWTGIFQTSGSRDSSSVSSSSRQVSSWEWDQTHWCYLCRVSSPFSSGFTLSRQYHDGPRKTHAPVLTPGKSGRSGWGHGAWKERGWLSPPLKTTVEVSASKARNPQLLKWKCSAANGRRLLLYLPSVILRLENGVFTVAYAENISKCGRHHFWIP